jgi:PEP-CTERM motif
MPRCTLYVLLATGLLLAAGSAELRAGTMSFTPPPGFAINKSQSDGLSVATYNAAGTYTGDTRKFLIEPGNEGTAEGSLSINAPTTVTSEYFPGLAAGGTSTVQIQLTEPPTEPPGLSDQILITVSRPVGTELLNATFELRSDPGPFIDPKGTQIPILQTLQETGSPQDITNFIFNPKADNLNGQQVTAFRVWVISDVEPVPEPGSLTLLGLGTLAVGGYGWLRRSWIAGGVTR